MNKSQNWHSCSITEVLWMDTGHTLTGSEIVLPTRPRKMPTRSTIGRSLLITIENPRTYSFDIRIREAVWKFLSSARSAACVCCSSAILILPKLWHVRLFCLVVQAKCWAQGWTRMDGRTSPQTQMMKWLTMLLLLFGKCGHFRARLLHICIHKEFYAARSLIMWNCGHNVQER